MVPYHIDNGLYLIITPYPGHGLKVKTSLSTEISTDDLPLDSVIVLVGRALTDWLLIKHPKKHEFYPVPHAVEALDSGPRSILARMKIAPLSSVPFNEIEPKFEDVFYNMDKPDENHLCATSIGLDLEEKIVGKPNQN